MSKELATSNNNSPVEWIPYGEAYYIVMRNKSLVTINEKRATTLMDQLVTQSSHQFVRVDDRTVNTADIVEIVKCEIYDQERP